MCGQESPEQITAYNDAGLQTRNMGPLGTQVQVGGKWVNSKDPNAIRAAMYRDQWSDYKRRFQPLEEKLLAISENPDKFFGEQRADALNQINAGYEGAMDMQQRRLGSYGLSLNDEQKSGLESALQRDKSLATVGAMNNLRREQQDTLDQIEGAGLKTRPTLGAK